MADPGEHELASERSRKASQTGSAKSGEAAPIDVPWQDEDFARISRIDAKQNTKRRKRKAAPKPTSVKPAPAKPTTAEPPSAVKAAAPVEVSGPPLHQPEALRPANSPAHAASDEPAPAETPARRDHNPEIGLDRRPFSSSPEKEKPREQTERKPPTPARPAAASPRPADESYTEPHVEPRNHRPSRAPVTEVRDIRHGVGPSLAPAGLLLLAAVGVGVVLASRMSVDLPSKRPNLVSSTESSPIRQPLDQALADTAATPLTAQPQKEHEVASLPPPPVARSEKENSAPAAADARPSGSDDEAAEGRPPPGEKSETVEAGPEIKESQRVVSQRSPAASDKAAPRSAARSSAPHRLASAEATLEPPEVATATPPAGSEIVAEVQTLLSALGYAPGPADGALRTQTRDAIRAFQIDASLPSTGEIDINLLTRLRRTEQVHWRFNG